MSKRFSRGPQSKPSHVCFGGSVDQGVVLYKGCARSRTSLRSSAFVLLDVVEAKGEDFDDYLKEDSRPIFFFVFSLHAFKHFWNFLRIFGAHNTFSFFESAMQWNAFLSLIEVISLDVRICYVENTASLLVSSLYGTDTPGAASTASINVFFVFF